MLFLPFPVLGISVHISLTPSRTILQWRSKALTRPRSFLLFRQLINTWVLFLTDYVRTERGPVLNSSSSLFSNSSGVISDFGLFMSAAAMANFWIFCNFSSKSKFSSAKLQKRCLRLVQVVFSSFRSSNFVYWNLPNNIWKMPKYQLR